MSARQPRFEIITTATEQHHARFRAANGAIVWVTETYKRKGKAENAIESLMGHFIGWDQNGATVVRGGRPTEVRYVDERSKP